MNPNALIWLVVSAAGVRLFILMSGTWSSIDVVMTYSTYDSNRYVVLADELLAGHGFARSYEEGPVHLAVEKLRRGNGTWPKDDNGYVPEGFRTPGYPLYLAMFGGHRGLDAALFMQCLLGSLCSALAAAVAFRLGLSANASFLVGALWAFHPAIVTTDLLVLTESLFTMIGLASLAALLFIRGVKGILLASLLIGFDGLVRPLGLLYLPCVLILSPLSQRKWLTIVATVIISMAPSVFWACRNADAGYGWRVSTVSEINLYYYGAAYTISESRGLDWKHNWPAQIQNLSTRLSLAQAEDVNSAMRRESLRVFAEHPTACLKVAAKSEVKLLVDHSMEYTLAQYRLSFESSGLFSDLLKGQLNIKRLTVSQLFSMMWMALNALLILLTFAGLVHFLRRRQWRLFFGCLITVLLFSVATFPVGLERFRVPFMYYMFLPASAVLFRKQPDAIQSRTPRASAS